MSAAERRPNEADTSIVSTEIGLVCLAVWYYWSWDAALMTGVALTALLLVIARLSKEDSNFACALLGVAWATGALFLLLKIKASVITCAIFVPLAGLWGYGGHLVAIEYLRASASDVTSST